MSDGEIASFSEESRRIKALDIASRAEIADMLKATGQRALEDSEVAGALVVLFSVEGDPYLNWEGLTWGDLDVLDIAVGAFRGLRTRFSYEKPQTVDQAVSKALKDRSLRKDFHEAIVSKEKREKPWICEHCGDYRRFKTERGATQHERRCRRNPNRRT